VTRSRPLREHPAGPSLHERGFRRFALQIQRVVQIELVEHARRRGDVAEITAWRDERGHSAAMTAGLPPPPPRVESAGNPKLDPTQIDHDTRHALGRQRAKALGKLTQVSTC